MKNVYGVWQIWYDCDYYKCSTLDSLWSDKRKAEWHAKEKTQEYINDYLDYFDDEEIKDRYGKSRTEVNIDDFSGSTIADNDIRSYEVYVHEIRTK